MIYLKYLFDYNFKASINSQLLTNNETCLFKSESHDAWFLYLFCIFKDNY